MMPDNLKRSIVIAALKSSFSIYCNRNNAAIDVTYRTWFIRSLYYNCLSILWARPCYLGTVHAAIRLTMRLLLFLWHCFAWNKTHVSIIIRQERTWLQFDDDAAIVASDNACAQGLLNLFEAWCSWASMSLRLDKCRCGCGVSVGSACRNATACMCKRCLTYRWSKGKFPQFQWTGNSLI